MSSSPQNFGVAGTWEPSLTRTYLPRCQNCESPHPLARRPAIISDFCPDCKEPVVEGQSETVPAVVAGGFPIANMLFRVARWLKKLSKEI